MLGFIGAKLVLHALHENELPFINGGEHVGRSRTSRSGSRLGVIVGTLAVTAVASLLASRSMSEQEIEQRTSRWTTPEERDRPE